jgi:hypothetical protein
MGQVVIHKKLFLRKRLYYLEYHTTSIDIEPSSTKMRGKSGIV